MKNKLGIPVLKNVNNSKFNNIIDLYQYRNGNKIYSRIINDLFGIHIRTYNVHKK